MQGCVLDCAEMMDVVLKKGSWYSYGDHRFVFWTEHLHSFAIALFRHFLHFNAIYIQYILFIRELYLYYIGLISVTCSLGANLILDPRVCVCLYLAA